ncbi:MAG: hypothetical protein FRX48_08835 [Lasallia pustulata]|uniref:Tetratricopeptide-like helical domain n=1 Tax=Lasallia pustulata TaxID=136370 RepID=A0A5M8PD84_9LECA|nr:MAG: hypothetical protein FRX48_08835 [Lasallia pustulata]
MSRPMLRLIHSRDSTNDLLFRANNHLGSNEPSKALPLYTKVLYETSPGHACAFLNRSLAYMALGYPELAAMDAYRAAVSADATRFGSDMADTRNLTMGKYLRAEKLHKESGAVWASSPECYTGPGWLRSPLASIVFGLDATPDPKTRHLVCRQLEVRALYRLVGALRECGGGVVREALDMLSDIIKKYRFTPMEKYWFDELGNQMLDEIAIMLERDGSPYNNQGEAKSKYWKDLETRTTMVAREVYPWNKHEPDYLDNNEIKRLQKYTDLIAKPCIAEYFQSFPEEAPTIHLVAARDINEGELVLSESTILQVATESLSWPDKYICNGCDAVLIIPKEHLEGIYARPRGWSPLATSSASQETNRNTSDDGDNQSQTDVPLFSQQQKKDPNSFPSPPFSPTAPKPPTPPARPHDPDFRLCPSCGEVAFCTDECAVQSSAFHNPLCTTWTEFELREAYQNKKAWTSSIEDTDRDLANHPKTHCIHDLLFVRIVASAVENASHPLDLDLVRYLPGGLWPRPTVPASPTQSTSLDLDLSDEPYLSATFSPPPADNRKSLSWSFESHVLRPLRYLARIGINTDLSFAQLEKYDGWVFNTLYAKIERSVRVTRSARRWVRYDVRGKIVGEGFVGDIEGEGEGGEVAAGSGTGQEERETEGGEAISHKKDAGTEDHEVWIGSLHPVLSMISAASSAPRGNESPNVVISDAGRAERIAIATAPAPAPLPDHNPDRDRDLIHHAALQSPDQHTNADADPGAGDAGSDILREGDEIDRLLYSALMLMQSDSASAENTDMEIGMGGGRGGGDGEEESEGMLDEPRMVGRSGDTVAIRAGERIRR